MIEGDLEVIPTYLNFETMLDGRIMKKPLFISNNFQDMIIINEISTADSRFSIKLINEKVIA